MHSPYRKLKINGRTVYEHRAVMERKLGRQLLRTEQVHHKNGVKTDNSMDNLEVKSPIEHGRLHFAKNPIEKVCEACGREFQPRPSHRKRDRGCSRQCRNVLVMFARLGADRVSKLDLPAVRSLAAAGESMRSVGRMFGVTHITVKRICAWPPPLAHAVGNSIARWMAARKAAA